MSHSPPRRPRRAHFWLAGEHDEIDSRYPSPVIVLEPPQKRSEKPALLPPPTLFKNEWYADSPSSSAPRRRDSWSRWLALPAVAAAVYGVLLFAGAAHVRVANGPGRWLAAERQVALSRVFNNIGPAAGAADGIVIASPSTGTNGEPDYYYTWTRDSALTISSLLPAFLPPAYLRPWEDEWHTSHPSRSHNTSHPILETLARAYATAQAEIQTRPNPSGDLWSGGLSEPKFNVTGMPFTGPWGRPQHDGPALRALALIPYAHWLLDRGDPADLAYVRDHLYNPLAARAPGSVIKNDLEHVAATWADSGFDIWEEVDGRHLFGDAVARRALQAGAGLATRLGDTRASDDYLELGERLYTQLGVYGGPVWRASVPREPLERTGLDAAVLLAVIHAGARDPNLITDARELAPTHPTVLATVRAYAQSFSGVYAVNSGPWTAGWLVGRYAEDVYDGVGFSGGNPWYLTTFALAHVLYLARAGFANAGRIAFEPEAHAFWTDVLKPVAGGRSTAVRPGLRFQSRNEHHETLPVPMKGEWLAGSAEYDHALVRLEQVADAYVMRALEAAPKARMSEQIDRETGEPRGARDLTWSYAALLDVVRARDAAARAVG